MKIGLNEKMLERILLWKFAGNVGLHWSDLSQGRSQGNYLRPQPPNYHQRQHPQHHQHPHDLMNRNWWAINFLDSVCLVALLSPTSTTRITLGPLYPIIPSPHLFFPIQDFPLLFFSFQNNTLITELLPYTSSQSIHPTYSTTVPHSSMTGYVQRRWWGFQKKFRLICEAQNNIPHKGTSPVFFRILS